MLTAMMRLSEVIKWRKASSTRAFLKHTRGRHRLMNPLPQQELLAVVDVHDCIIGTCARHIVHATGLRHRAVHILVFDDAGRLFLQKRSMNKDLNPGLWDTSAAGHVDADEDYTSSAIRELREELGLTDHGRLLPLFKIPPTAYNGMEFVRVYCITHNGPFALAADEIDGGDWFTPSQIDALVSADVPELTPTFKIIWRQWTANSD
jgi:isopentenyldiphosphate isomerase